MTIRYSTGLANAVLDKVKEVYTDAAIDIYSGTQPINPDDPMTSTLLAQVTSAGGVFVEGVAANGINFTAPVDGLLEKDPVQEWKYTGLASGTARWFRLRANAADDDGQSAMAVRLDGTIGSVSGDMVLSNIGITVGAPGTIDKFQIRRKAA